MNAYSYSCWMGRWLYTEKCIKNCVSSFDGGRAINYDITNGELWRILLSQFGKDVFVHNPWVLCVIYKIKLFLEKPKLLTHTTRTVHRKVRHIWNIHMHRYRYIAELKRVGEGLGTTKKRPRFCVLQLRPRFCYLLIQKL